LASTHSLHQTQYPIASTSLSSFSTLVYPVHHLQSLPIPPLLLGSPPSVPLLRLPMLCSSLFPPLRPQPSYDFAVFNRQSPRHPRSHILSPLLSQCFRSHPPFDHHYDLIRATPSSLSHSTPAPTPPSSPLVSPLGAFTPLFGVGLHRMSLYIHVLHSVDNVKHFLRRKPPSRPSLHITPFS